MNAFLQVIVKNSMSPKIPKPRVILKRLPNGKTEVSVLNDFFILGASLPNEFAKMAIPGKLLNNVTVSRRKVEIAKWYLQRLADCLFNEAAALLFLEGFVSELRSTTFALQYQFNKVDGFLAWYQQQQDQMRSDPLLRWLIEARNQAQKQGLTFANWGHHVVVKFYSNGVVDAENMEPVLEVSGIETEVSLAGLNAMIQRLEIIIEQAHEKFPCPPGDGRHHLEVEYVRERDDGTWEHFAPG